MKKHPQLTSLKIKGYRPFRDFVAPLSPLEVIVGSNGSGKSSLFEFMKFLRDAMQGDIPSEIIPGSIGQQIFHVPGPEKFTWDLEIDLGGEVPVRYQAGPFRVPAARPTTNGRKTTPVWIWIGTGGVTGGSDPTDR